MPRPRGLASPLPRVPRVPRVVPPRVPLVCAVVPPRMEGAGTRDVLDLGAGVWNLDMAVLVDEGFSTKDVSVVLCNETG